MPRTSTVESPGCPPLRALTSDVLGLVKVVEAHGGKNGGDAKMVERWGDPDASNCVLATSILDRESNPLLGIARKSGSIEVVSAVNGAPQVHIPNIFQAESTAVDDSLIGLHLFRKHQPESSSRSCKLLTCTAKGVAYLASVESGSNPVTDSSPTKWNICAKGNLLCSKVDQSETYAIYGGKCVEVNAWDLEKSVRIWTAKSPPKNSLGIFTPTCITSTTFLRKEDHRKVVAGTDAHQVRLYDISAQRRPVLSVDFRETAIKVVAEDGDGHTVYVGNSSGDLASFDMRTGKLLGCFIGKCSGSIRSIVRHTELPVIASCGLDSYLRIWDVQNRQLLAAVFLKQHLTSVVFDTHFKSKEVAGSVPEIASVETHTEAVAAVKRKKKFSKGDEEEEGVRKEMKHKKKKKKKEET